MSHFYALVLLKPEQVTRLCFSKPDFDEAIRPLLAPYDENKEVDEYDKPCFCIGQLAQRAAREVAEKFRPFEELRAEFHREHPPTKEDPFGDAVDHLWKAHIKPYQDVKAAAFTAHPLRDKPATDCEECKGTGTYRSTYNPKSEWDWYCIGGRWTGALGDYDPEKDPANIETCDLCDGTGKRADAVGKQARKKDPAYDCNGCQGKGKRVKWPTQWRGGAEEVGNVAPAREVLADDKRIPFAIITPDGAWSERGKMGWFGSVRDEKDQDDWKAQVKQIIEAHADCLAVVVDCHI